MRTKTLLGAAAVVLLAVAGVAWANRGEVRLECCGDCCYPGSPCCYPGSSCCDDCCFTGSECCFPGSPCCEPGSACCGLTAAKAGGSCCTEAKGEKAGAEGCCGK